jgi:hypothetical protein
MLPHAANTALAYDRFVSTTGTDSGDCMSGDCATVNYAVGQAIAGDTIFIRPGTYDLGNESGECINISKSLTVTASDTQNMPILQGLSSKSYCLRISADNVTLSYVKVYHGTGKTGFPSWATAIDIRGEHAVVDHCHARYSNSGIWVGVRRYVTISNCTWFKRNDIGNLMG